MKYLPLLLINLLFGAAYAQQSLQEKLGYAKETKLLIVHADDLGVSHSENRASIYALENGIVNSASIMVPCPWFPEIARYARQNPEADLGLHLTLNSEWHPYKWSPVSDRKDVASLLDTTGYFFDSVQKLTAQAKPDEVRKELTAQIERAIAFGINPTHFDAHMGAAFSTPELLKIYIELGRKYRVPVMLNGPMLSAWYGIDMNSFINEKDVVVDRIYSASPENYDNEGMEAFYSNTLKALERGLNCIILHAAYDDDEMRAMTEGHPYYHAPWRQQDFDFFSSEKAKKIIRDKDIQLITWKEIRDKIVRK